MKEEMEVEKEDSGQRQRSRSRERGRKEGTRWEGLERKAKAILWMDSASMRDS